MAATWRFLNTGFADGAFNMGVDEILLQSLGAGGRPALRVFGWKPPAVSFGYGQDPARQVDVEKCRRLGIDLVRRPTGGRAVLHWEELTYSVVCRRDDPHLGGSVAETYCAIGRGLVEGLALFGVKAALERVRIRPGPGRQQKSLTAPCFSSIARWEVKCQGRKLIGSAQRRSGGAILQHGSLLIGDAHRKLLDLLPPGAERWREEMAGQLESGSIHLRHCVEGEVDFDVLAACLARGFSRCLRLEMEPASLSPAECRAARQRASTRFSQRQRQPLTAEA